MTNVALLLDAFDQNWSHQWESLQPLLQDVSSDEACWQHPSYVSEQDPKGLPEPGTIRWHLGHLEMCARRYVQILHTRPVAENPNVPPPSLTDVRELVRHLEQTRSELRAEIACIDDASLTARCRGEMTVAEFLLMVIRHEAWHAGQIVVIRRLYRTRGQ